MLVVGVMSGTSVDGIDVAVCECSHKPELSVQCVHFQTVEWKAEHRTQIFSLIHSKETTLQQVAKANFALGTAYADAVMRVLQDFKIEPKAISAIACHGQTIYHEPPFSTLQIGEPSMIAQSTGITTIADFRVADIAVMGQGAPLTSSFDYMLLRPEAATQGDATHRHWRAVQNIGGIGNVTLLPPKGTDTPPIAFDTGPGNVFIDFAAAACDASLTQDTEGKLGAAGTCNATLLGEMMALEYIKRRPPKTTGRELFSKKMFEKWQAKAEELGMSKVDLVTTVTEFTACSIAESYRHLHTSTSSSDSTGARGASTEIVNCVAEVIVGGGGTRNPFLMERLRAQLQLQQPQALPVRVVTHEEIGINSDAKEAMAFALLGYLCLEGTPSNVPACTGASRPCIMGKVCPGRNFKCAVLASES